MPEAEGGEALIAMAQSLGWHEFGAMGPVPLSAQEIMAWCAGTGERLTQWEFVMLRDMSVAYVGGAHAKTAPYEGMMVRMALASASFMGAGQSGGGKTSRP